MKRLIRRMAPCEVTLLRDFLYLAIFVPAGVQPPDPAILEEPALRKYTESFGRAGDLALVCEVDCRIVGVVWARFFDAAANSYSFYRDDYAEISLAVVPEFRNQGIGRALLMNLMNEAQRMGTHGLSLSVSQANFAAALYRSVGFETVAEREDDLLMALHLQPPGSVEAGAT